MAAALEYGSTCACWNCCERIPLGGLLRRSNNCAAPKVPMPTESFAE